MLARNITPVLLFAALFFVAASGSLCPTGTLTYYPSSPLTLNGDYSDCSSITFYGVSVTLQGSYKHNINALPYNGINSNITTVQGSFFTNVTWVFNGGGTLKHQFNTYYVSNYANVKLNFVQAGADSTWVCTDAYTVTSPAGFTKIGNLSLLVSNISIAAQKKASFNAQVLQATYFVWQGGNVTVSYLTVTNPDFQFTPGFPLSSSCTTTEINFANVPRYNPVVPDSGESSLEIVVAYNPNYPASTSDPTYCNGLQMNYTSDITITGDVINCEINAIGCSVTFTANVTGSRINGIYNGVYAYVHTTDTAIVSNSNFVLEQDETQFYAETPSLGTTNMTLTGSAYVQLAEPNTNVNRIDILNTNSADYDANPEAWLTGPYSININILRYQAGRVSIGGGGMWTTNINQFQFKPVGNVPMLIQVFTKAGGYINYVPWDDTM